uniref:Uncharacterized protein n=1 Tax=viral metagenome TaxID=1070528 RepID=A0A6C0C7A7_9ZZZZ
MNCNGDRCQIVDCPNQHPNPICMTPNCGKRCPPMRNRPGRYYSNCHPDCKETSKSATVSQTKKAVEDMIPAWQIKQKLSGTGNLNENYNTPAYINHGFMQFLWNQPTSRGGTNMSFWGHLLSETDRQTIFIPIFCGIFFSEMSGDPNHWVKYINSGIVNIIHSVMNDPSNLNRELTIRRVLEFTY